ncbi:hypothetical protein J7J83_04145 [bacterium]|nr:hypothetical protein [bacterium]
MITDILVGVGFTKKEAKVYLANLELGQSVISKIAKRAEINRVTTYDIVEKLIHKGFIHFITKHGVKFFSPTKPDLIFQNTKKKIDSFQKSLPALRRLHGETVHPRVRYFEGLDGIKYIYEDTLSSKTDISNFSNSAEIRRFWPTYDEDYVKKRAKKKIFLRGVSPLDEAGLQVKSENKKYYRDIKLIPHKKYDFSNEINIYDDKVSIISFKEGLIGMIIESKEIADTQRIIFKMVWDFAKSL